MYKNILVPMDFTSMAKKAFGVALEMAGAAGAATHLVSVLPDYGFGIVAQHFAPGAQEQAREETLKTLQQWAARISGGGATLGQLVVRYGKIYEEILTAAKECKADLVVIAGRSGENIGPFPMGSNSEKVVRYSGCSVLAIKDEK